VTIPAVDSADIDSFIASMVAMGVRDALHDQGVDKDLSTEVLAKINATVRDGAYTVLHCMGNTAESAQLYLGFLEQLLPDYWQDPKLLAAYTELQVGDGLATLGVEQFDVEVSEHLAEDDVDEDEDA
jgi:hypothetical protein